MDHLSFVDRVAHLFRQSPNTWIDGLEIAKVGGCYAYRTRISDCRRQLGMTIENRLVRRGGVVSSQYRYVPRSVPQQMEMTGL